MGDAAELESEEKWPEREDVSRTESEQPDYAEDYDSMQKRYEDPAEAAKAAQMKVVEDLKAERREAKLKRGREIGAYATEEEVHYPYGHDQQRQLPQMHLSNAPSYQPKLEESEPRPTVHLSYDNADGLEIDIWVTGSREGISFDAMADRANRAMREARYPSATERLAKSVQPKAQRRREPEKYPYEDGDVAVLGPETFVDSDRQVICWKGVNYYRPSEAPEPKHPSPVVDPPPAPHNPVA